MSKKKKIFCSWLSVFALPFAITTCERDYSAEIGDTFGKFKQGAVHDYVVKYRSAPHEMNHIECRDMGFVAQLHSDLFLRLETFCERNAGFIDETIADFDREIQFYVAYLEHVAKFARLGLRVSLPIMSRIESRVCHDAFDLALAQMLLKGDVSIVCNDFVLKGGERIIVVTGPNQGGKTTFARMFGQLHYLANLGCPAPAEKARLLRSTSSLRISNERRASLRCAASWRMTSSGFITFWSEQHHILLSC